MSTTISIQLPRREGSSLQVPIRSYKTLVEAERAVALVKECCFPLEFVTLAARGDKSCPQRSAVSTSRTAAVMVGTLTGAVLVTCAHIAGALGTSESALFALLFGATLGAIVGCFANRHVVPKRSTCYCSHGIAAHCYDVLIDAQWAGDAAQVLTAADSCAPRK